MDSDGIAVLKAEIGHLAERVEGLEKVRDQVDALADQMLAESHGEPHATPRPEDAPTAPVAWTDLDAEQARATFDELRAWMVTVLTQHPRVLEVLRPCWYRHPAVVQVLLDVRAAWLLAYRNPQPASAVQWALDWSRLHLPHLEDALTRELGRCSGVRHDPDRVPMPSVDERDAHAYLQWWADSRDPTTEPPDPGPPQHHQ